MTDKAKTSAIMDALVKQAGDSIWASELQFFQGARRCDFWTISPNSSSGFKARAYEVKVSRGDFKRDSFEKQRGARLFADQFFYVAPRGLVTVEEIPDWAGLIEFDGGVLKQVRNAPLLDKCAPSWERSLADTQQRRAESGPIAAETESARGQQANFGGKRLGQKQRASTLADWSQIKVDGPVNAARLAGLVTYYRGIYREPHRQKPAPTRDADRALPYGFRAKN